MRKLLTLISITFLGMFGGQTKGKKAYRRYGIPLLAIATLLKYKWNWRYLGLLLLIPLLSMGYGVNSWLMALLQDDTLVRIAYGLILGLPFFFFGWIRGIIACVSLAIAWSVRGGNLGYIEWFGDLLVEDIIRYSILGLNIIFLKGERKGERK